MKKITIVGFFAHNSNYNGGQENKTRAVYKILKERYGENQSEEIIKSTFEKSIKEDKKSPEVIAKEIKNMKFKTQMCARTIRNNI